MKVSKHGPVAAGKRFSFSTGRFPFCLPLVRTTTHRLRARRSRAHSNILAGVAGITSDANSLVNYARNACQRHLLTYDEEIPVEMLAKTLCDMKQGYTQFGGTSLFTRAKFQG